jgi:hypothetical protein
MLTTTSQIFFLYNLLIPDLLAVFLNFREKNEIVFGKKVAILTSFVEKKSLTPTNPDLTRGLGLGLEVRG